MNTFIKTQKSRPYLYLRRQLSNYDIQHPTILAEIHLGSPEFKKHCRYHWNGSYHKLYFGFIHNKPVIKPYWFPHAILIQYLYESKHDNDRCRQRLFGKFMASRSRIEQYINKNSNLQLNTTIYGYTYQVVLRPESQY